ncbi:MAG: type II toxin-antitoxin system death-on-curing family toxin [Candidatus Eremiobacteraeota bacterium]|nr:type II toxin-antitoxin system death-on-curing family toxin [Candidatus Eremiobacteraeota bacterium]MCW5870758.1 type II toxin-antitoxin system death-on-curing family toxin [Candidatus Eremiobacteraeota bacterium]
MNEIFFLDLNDVLVIHQNTLEHEGGAQGIRDIALVESAVAAPAASFGGQYLHPNIASMAAALMFSLVSNHGFVDGNKRVGTLATLVFRDVNGIEVYPPAHQLERVALAVASGQMNQEELRQYWSGLLNP